MFNPYDTFQDFMNTYDFWAKPIPGYQNINVNRLGQVYDNNWNQINPYHYNNQYDTIYVRDLYNNPHVIGVHQAVAKTFKPDEYYPGCVVHHKDEAKYNNYEYNLEISNRIDHGRHHNPGKYQPVWQTCQVCGKQFLWDPMSQKRYYIDINRGKNRIITCSRNCASRYGRMMQLNNI